MNRWSTQLFDGAQPNGAVEAIAANYFKLVRRIREHARRPLTLETIDYLHYSLLEGIAAQELAGVERGHVDVRVDSGPTKADSEFARAMLEACLRGAESPDNELPIPFVAVELTSVFWDIAPFEQANAFTESLTRMLFFLRNELDGLAYVPFSYLNDGDGGDRLADSMLANFDRMSGIVDTQEGIDCTLLYAQAATLMLTGLRELEQELSREENAMEELRTRFRNVPGLNERQIEFLAMQHRLRKDTITIATYRTMFQVSYNTANKDLFELADRGLVSYNPSNRAAAFRFF